MALSATQLEDLGYPGRDVFFEKCLGEHLALTYGDVTLATNRSNVLPNQPNVRTRLGKIELPIPIISADMDTVTGHRMAIAMAKHGGLGMIHYNMTREEQVREVARVKHHIHGVIDEPVTVSPDMKIGDVVKLREEKGYTFGTFPVVDSEKKLCGLISSSHLAEMHKDKKVGDIMTPRKDVSVIRKSQLGSNPLTIARDFFREHPGKNKLPIIDEDNILQGLVTLSDVEREQAGQGASMARDESGRLRVGVSLQTIRGKTGKLNTKLMRAYIMSLLEEGADALLIGSAHAHTQGVLETVKFVRKIADITLVAGNVTSARSVIDLADAGANAIKVGQGPGSICTTRQVAGVGIPQLSAVYLAAKAAEEKGVQIIADGGVQTSGDIVKAFAAGANAVMLGSLLGVTDEAPGDIFEIDGKRYKSYRGMGSTAAMRDGSAARYGHDKGNITTKTAPEGIEAMKPASGPVGPVLMNLVGGIQSGMGYLGARELQEIRDKARFVRMTASGGRESGIHDVIEVKTSSK